MTSDNDERPGKSPAAPEPLPDAVAAPAAEDPQQTLNRLIQSHSERVLQSLVEIVTGGESPQARVAAANAILDRGYGKPKSPAEKESSKQVHVEIVKFRDREDQTPGE